jgi:spore maturation protein CgeB
LDVLDEPIGNQKSADVVFVGSLFPGVHDGRIRLLEAVCERFPGTGVWSASVAHLDAESPIRRCYRGQAWGKRMYELFRSARIVLNHHGDAFAFADNCRLYETTGVGAFLLTEAHRNLPELFEPGHEVGTYRDEADCLAAIERYLNDERTREAIAAAGQARTLREHTYRLRMGELTEIIESLRGSAA